jgi:hypothetical protein
MNTYSIKVTFTTNRPLTDDELGLLYFQVLAQVEEPTDEEGNDATYEIYSTTHSSLRESN